MNNYEFITLEGIEGVGKSTAMRVVKRFLENNGRNVIITREPGGTAIGEKVRDILLSTQNDAMSPVSELFLLLAARAQHLAEVVSPALASGNCVVCDRFFDATYAYQGAGRGLDMSIIKSATDLISPFFVPTLTLLLDAPVEVGFKRIESRGKTDRFEEQNRDFFERIRESYLNRARLEPKRFCVIDASQSLVEVSDRIELVLKEKFSN
ncbi:MAG: dTMP kinase [Gammaproteobacteria bacterium]